MLLSRGDVNPNQPDPEYGRTPLMLAAWGGHEGVVKILLERKDVFTFTTDCENETPFSRALSAGHHRVASMVFERDSVNYC
jgi:ankyrin repeat protein